MVSAEPTIGAMLTGGILVTGGTPENGAGNREG